MGRGGCVYRQPSAYFVILIDGTDFLELWIGASHYSLEMGRNN